MARLFGTDGVRGIANEDLSPELAFKLGQAVGGLLTRKGNRCKMVVGKDTRISSDMLEAAIIAGITSSGTDVLRVGVLPTPAVAFLTAQLPADAGVMISASHNPVEYNGIKFFSSDGYKFSDELEEEIEDIVQSEKDFFPRPTKDKVGMVQEASDFSVLYQHHLKSSSEDLSGFKLVVDCANGAAFEIAPKVLTALGANVIAINHDPNGLNINLKCGSTSPESLIDAVMEHGADAGLAYDGDADRLMAVDDKGQILNGDKIMAICGLDMVKRNELPDKTIVATAYSNLGLTKLFEGIGGRVLIADNGDRYVLEKMRENHLALGGEQSGHIIFSRYATTGDGILTSLQLLSAMKRDDAALSELGNTMVEFPQLLINVYVVDKKKALEREQVIAAIDKAKKLLEGRGRLHVRPSGTEPLIRVMGEGPNREELQSILEEVANVIGDKA